MSKLITTVDLRWQESIGDDNNFNGDLLILHTIKMNVVKAYIYSEMVGQIDENTEKKTVI